MHILHMIDALHRGGAERMLVDIANATVKDGHIASVCVTRQGIGMASELAPAIRVWELNRHKRFDWQAFRRLDQLVRDTNVDVLHVHGHSTLSLVVTLKTLGLLRVPVVLHDHYGSIEIDGRLPVWLRLSGKHFVACYVGVHPRLGTLAKAAGIAADRVFVIDNALNLNRLEESETLNLPQAFQLTSNVPIGVIVCGIRYDKGVDLALSAIAALKQSDFFVLIIGGDRDPKYAEACRQQCVALGLSDKVFFIGERADVPAILRGSDFALLPSRSESGPLVLLEYMYAKLPFAAFQAGSISQRVSELGVPGFVAPGDVAGFSQAIATLVRLAPLMRQARGEQGHLIVKQYFDIQQVMPQWYTIYQKALQPA